jgi:hypothetical protein
MVILALLIVGNFRLLARLIVIVQPVAVVQNGRNVTKSRGADGSRVSLLLRHLPQRCKRREGGYGQDTLDREE